MIGSDRRDGGSTVGVTYHRIFNPASAGKSGHNAALLQLPDQRPVDPRDPRVEDKALGAATTQGDYRIPQSVVMLVCRTMRSWEWELQARTY